MPQIRIPRGSHGEITTKQQPDGRWIARVQVRDIDGRIRSVRIKGTTKSGALRAMRDRLDETHRPHHQRDHCVTRESLLLALTALDVVGRRIGDRIEHGAIIPDPSQLKGLTVVTQPAFTTVHAERYRRDVDIDDQPYLYRFRSCWRQTSGPSLRTMRRTAR